MRILLVDSNDDYRRLMRKTLEEKSCVVYEVNNGLKALNLANSHKPDLIISGGLMPEMDGIKLLKEIKSNRALENTRFIFHSKFYSEEREKNLSISLGVDAFLGRKIKVEELWDLINQVTKFPIKTNVISEEDFIKTYNEILFEKLLNIESKSRYEQQQSLNLFNSIRDAVIVSDVNRNIIKANQPATKEIFGFENHELIGRNARILYPDEATYKLLGQEVFDFKHYIVGKILYVNAKRKDGEIFPVEVYAMKLINEKGEANGNITIFRDISQRARAEKQFKNLLDAFPDRIALISPDLRVIWVNDFSLKYLNKKIEDVIGKFCYELWHGRTEPCQECAVRETLKTLKSSTINITTPDKRLWEVRTFPIKNEKDELISVVSISRDITEHRKLEEQLRQAQKMEAIGQLAGGIAHDFNNILTGIIGYATLIQLKIENNDPIKPYIDLILSLTEKAKNLTQGLLAFSRRQIMNIKPVNINEIIKTSEKMLSRILREDIEIKTYLLDQDLIALVDANQIEHVLINLAINACDAMPDGGILTISTDLVDIDEDYVKTHGYGKPGKYILISVEDTGIGMTPAVKDRIFEPFFTTKGAGKGTGLGLSIVYGTIKQLDGYINVYSEVSKGTTFKIYLPAFNVKPIDYRKYDSTVVYTLTGNETILLAEDEKSVREGIREILENYGYRVIEACDGEDALYKFRENKDFIDLLIIDVIMPIKNGRDAYLEMLNEKPDLKALFMSGYTSNIIHKRGILNEGINFIPKPITPIELLRKIREILDSK